MSPSVKSTFDCELALLLVFFATPIVLLCSSFLPRDDKYSTNFSNRWRAKVPNHRVALPKFPMLSPCMKFWSILFLASLWLLAPRTLRELVSLLQLTGEWLYFADVSSSIIHCVLNHYAAITPVLRPALLTPVHYLLCIQSREELSLASQIQCYLAEKQVMSSVILYVNLAESCTVLSIRMKERRAVSHACSGFSCYPLCSRIPIVIHSSFLLNNFQPHLVLVSDSWAVLDILLTKPWNTSRVFC